MLPPERYFSARELHSHAMTTTANEYAAKMKKEGIGDIYIVLNPILMTPVIMLDARKTGSGAAFIISKVTTRTPAPPAAESTSIVVNIRNDERANTRRM